MINNKPQVLEKVKEKNLSSINLFQNINNIQDSNYEKEKMNT
jgi:hypothetical protein